MFRDIPIDFTQPTVDKTQISFGCDVIINHSRVTNPRFTLDYFSDIYSKEIIESDKKTIREIQSSFIRRDSRLPETDQIKLEHSKKRSEALETIIADQIESSDWFGSNSLFFRTTEYDDLINGVDAVVEFNIGDQDNPERIALSVDSTSKTDTRSIGEKIDRNIAKIFNNKLEVKYFESPNLDIDHPYKGPLKDIIPVVIGLEARNTNQLIETFSHMIQLDQQRSDQSLDPDKRTHSSKEFSQLRRQIENDPVQIVFLKEIRRQLELYIKLLDQENNPNIHIKNTLVSKLLGIVETIIDEKDEIEQSPKMALLRNDTVYNFIGYHCQKRHL